MHTHTRIYKFRILVYARDFVCVSEKSFSLSHSVARAKPFGNGQGLNFLFPRPLLYIYTHIHLCALILVYMYIGGIRLYIVTRAKRNSAVDRRADFCLGFTIGIYIYLARRRRRRWRRRNGGCRTNTYLPTFIFLSTSAAVTFVCFYPLLIYNKSSKHVGFIISRVPLAPKLCNINVYVLGILDKLSTFAGFFSDVFISYILYRYS